MPHGGQTLNADFSHDGSKLVTRSTDSFARLWEVPSGKAFGPPLQHGSEVTNAEFTADDAYLVTRTGDGWARVWRVATGELALEPIRGGDGYTGSVHPSRPEVILAGTDGILRRWNIVPGALRPMEIPADPQRVAIERSARGEATAWDRWTTWDWHECVTFRSTRTRAAT
jgi:WD40 repeat protein